jgi:hypothetical protein
MNKGNTITTISPQSLYWSDLGPQSKHAKPTNEEEEEEEEECVM